MTDLAFKFFFLLRFLCFVAVVYLALHKIVARLSHKPNSKLLWFFSVVTAPLTRPIRTWMASGTEDDRIVSTALIFYAALWLFVVLAGQFLTRAIV